MDALQGQVERLTSDLRELLLAAQRKGKAPQGMAKCPACGTVIEPTKTKRIRTHQIALLGIKCEASGKPWAAFHKRPPRRRPPARPTAASRAARRPAPARP
ncbi:MAG: hypothetical protein QOD77_2153 [Thermoplasmata archaeon]|nr:hypothetical protein [Thermoplasmata archaeon]